MGMCEYRVIWSLLSPATAIGANLLYHVRIGPMACGYQSFQDGKSKTFTSSAMSMLQTRTRRYNSRSSMLPEYQPSRMHEETPGGTVTQSTASSL